MTLLLASVADAGEAQTALAAGVDIIDAKDPSAGTLGAVSISDLAAIVASARGHCPVSATVGDLPMEPTGLLAAALRTAEIGVDFVKIGLFSGDERRACIDALGTISDRAALVAVMFADQHPAIHLIPLLARAGFCGVMLDSADKRRGGLRELADESLLAAFLASARDHGLLCGLAGSLRREDIEPLLALGPDILGFRGALCEAKVRTAPLADNACRAIRSCIGRDDRTGLRLRPNRSSDCRAA